jgi:hypothetical protein
VLSRKRIRAAVSPNAVSGAAGVVSPVQKVEIKARRDSSRRMQVGAAIGKF